jgi:integrase
MPAVFKQQYTRPIPADSQPATVKRKRKGQEVELAAVRFKVDGKWVVAPVVESGKQAGTHCRVVSPTWYGRVKGVVVPLCTNKAAAEVMLADKIREAERGVAGMVDPHDKHNKAPLAEHLDAWRDDLLAKGTTRGQVDLVVSRARRVVEGCGFAKLPELVAADSATAVQAFLAEMRRPAIAPDLPRGKTEWTKAELALALGVQPCTVNALVRRHRLDAMGNGKARRYPLPTVLALLEQSSQGNSIQTSNHYLAAIKQFCRWLVRNGRTAKNPFADLSGGNVRLDRRHDRQTLSAGQLRSLLEKTRDSDRLFRGLAGRDRMALYATACGIGFRRNELASLTPEHFDLGDSPTVTISARKAKNRTRETLPLASALADLLRAYLEGKPAGLPLWPGTWVQRAAEMLRLDLEPAGIPYVVPGPDGPLYADLHSLRHSFVALLDQAGVSLKQAMQLARHSDPKLTMARYGKARLSDLAGAVDRLPDLTTPANRTMPVILRATGTDHRTAGPLPAVLPYTPLTQAPDGERRSLMASEDSLAQTAALPSSHNPLSGKGFDGERGRMMADESVRPAGFEPATPGLGNRCSIH